MTNSIDKTKRVYQDFLTSSRASFTVTSQSHINGTRLNLPSGCHHISSSLQCWTSIVRALKVIMPSKVRIYFRPSQMQLAQSSMFLLHSQIKTIQTGKNGIRKFCSSHICTGSGLALINSCSRFDRQLYFDLDTSGNIMRDHTIDWLISFILGIQRPESMTQCLSHDV